jgi:peptidoglycan hydrolase-like protein with peptidoglycan-binding domain
LASSGHWNAVPNQDFGQRLFQAISNFQRENGFEPTGFLPAPEMQRLVEAARPALALWGTQRNQASDP